MLASALTSDPGGAFAVPAGYMCPSRSSLLYIVARGGTLAATPDASHAAISMLTAVGSCSATARLGSVLVNEATTVAAAYALAQFLAPGGNIGASATNGTGLANALATAASLVGTQTGVPPGAAFPANGSAPIAQIGSLANLLNSCVVSAGSTGTSSACGRLFLAASAAGAGVPDNTLDATLNIVRNPGSNVSAIFAQSRASTAYTPGLRAEPSDWTLFVTFAGGGMNGPSSLGVDAPGNVWVASYAGVATKLSPQGDILISTTQGGLHNSYGLAIDGSNNAWIANRESASSVNGGHGSVTVFDSAGQPLSGASGYVAGGIDYPNAVAIDPNSNAWIVDYGDSHMTLLTNGGQPLSGTDGFTTPLLGFPVAVAVTADHNAWVADQTGSAITLVSGNGSQFRNVTCCDAASGLAIDAQGNVWVANYYGDSVSEISSTGALLSSGYRAPSIHHPQGIAVDGAGTVWVANYRGFSVSELAGAGTTSPGSTLSPVAGWAPDASLVEPFAIAIDSSGDLWVSNFGGDTVTEIVGLASPVKTPLLGPVQVP